MYVYTEMERSTWMCMRMCACVCIQRWRGPCGCVYVCMCVFTEMERSLWMYICREKGTYLCGRGCIER